VSGAYAPGEIGGPEIVGPEPETVEPYQESSQNALGSTATQTHPVTGGTPFKRQEATKAAQSAQSGHIPTPESKTKMIAQLCGENDAHRADATEYFVQIGQLMPNEALEDLPLRFIPQP
jgi:hypothetical protein